MSTLTGLARDLAHLTRSERIYWQAGGDDAARALAEEFERFAAATPELDPDTRLRYLVRLARCIDPACPLDVDAALGLLVTQESPPAGCTWEHVAAADDAMYTLPLGNATPAAVLRDAIAQLLARTQAATLGPVLADVTAERARQHARWGEQNLPDGTGPERHVLDFPALPQYATLARMARLDVDERARDGRLQWAEILLEEVAEALAEDDPGRLRAELVQVAAVAAQWVEAIDRQARP